MGGVEDATPKKQKQRERWKIEEEEDKFITRSHAIIIVAVSNLHRTVATEKADTHVYDITQFCFMYASSK